MDSSKPKIEEKQGAYVPGQIKFWQPVTQGKGGKSRPKIKTDSKQPQSSEEEPWWQRY